MVKYEGAVVVGFIAGLVAALMLAVVAHSITFPSVVYASKPPDLKKTWAGAKPRSPWMPRPNPVTKEGPETIATITGWSVPTEVTRIVDDEFGNVCYLSIYRAYGAAISCLPQGSVPVASLHAEVEP